VRRVLASVIGAVLILPGVAHAAFPGENGKLAFWSTRTDPAADLFTANPDGSALTPIRATSFTEELPAWSPDGTKIAFASDRDGDQEIYTTNTDGSVVTRLNSGQGFYPDWAPEGTKIAFQSTRDSAPEIYTMNADGSGVAMLANSVAFDGEPAWSPDGTKIAFATFLDPDIYTVNADGSAATNISTNPAVDELPDWQPIINSSPYPRPKSATPVQVSLVPAYTSCGSPNTTHGPPLAYPSCEPPAQLSQHATVGTSDANGNPANSVGSVSVKVVVGDPTTTADEADVRLATSITDVRVRGDLSDYTGELLVSIGLRMTDRYNGPSLAEGATASDAALSWVVPCSTTPDTGIGSSCASNTTADALVPGTVPESKRSIWALDKVEVYDGGPDGLASTIAGNTLFETQGVFVP
jgi:WD40-like Beta Propeller Repeat